MAVVVFNEDDFRAAYPGLSDEEKYPVEMLERYFDLACAFVGNTDATSLAPYNPDKGETLRERLLYLATCHLATILTGDAAPGRIASASQGSISTSFDLVKSSSTSGDWWMQTQCGATFWILMQRYRWGGRITALKHRHPFG